MKIINGDSVEEMKKLEEGSIDLTVTSPPYDNLRTYNGNNDLWNENVWKDTIKELFRVTKDGGVVVWVVGDATIKGSETGTSFKQALWAIECGFNLHDTMIYEKVGVMPSNTRYPQMFEYMFVWSKGKPTFNAIKDRKNNWGNTKTGNIGQRQTDGSIKKRGVKEIAEFGMRFNIWRIQNEGGWNNKDPLTKLHPATFPESLAHDHIISWSNEGDVVLDPFMGSGTTGKMAKQLGRNFIGIELDKEYCKIAEARINQIQLSALNDLE